MHATFEPPCWRLRACIHEKIRGHASRHEDSCVEHFCKSQRIAPTVARLPRPAASHSQSPSLLSDLLRPAVTAAAPRLSQLARFSPERASARYDASPHSTATVHSSHIRLSRSSASSARVISLPAALRPETQLASFHRCALLHAAARRCAAPCSDPPFTCAPQKA
jgi:hypothetical protein